MTPFEVGEVKIKARASYKSDADVPQNDYSLGDVLQGPETIVRAANSDGDPITEREEVALVPVLERLSVIFGLQETLMEFIANGTESRPETSTCPEDQTTAVFGEWAKELLDGDGAASWDTRWRRKFIGVDHFEESITRQLDDTDGEATSDHLLAEMLPDADAETTSFDLGNTSLNIDLFLDQLLSGAVACEVGKGAAGKLQTEDDQAGRDRSKDHCIVDFTVEMFSGLEEQAVLARKSITSLNILTAEDVSTFLRDRTSISEKLEELGATVGHGRHLLRLLVVLVLGGMSGSASTPSFIGPAAVFVLELFLPFFPVPHPVTAAAHHFGGGTWIGIRRIDLMCVLILQWCIARIATSTWVRLQTSTLLQRWLVEDSASEARFRNKIHSVFSVLFFAAFMGMAWQLWAATPSGWIYPLFTHGDPKAFEEECGAEFTLDLAVEMHECYCLLVLINLVRTFLHGFCTGATKRDTLNVAFESPHWFWAMVLYFSPLDDAALPLLMECVRQMVTEVGNVTEQQDYLIGPLTACIELAHWGVTVLHGCHYPLIMYVRVLALLEGMIVAIQNLTSWMHSFRNNAGGWVRSSSSGLEAVTVYRPHDGPDDPYDPATNEQLRQGGIFPEHFLNNKDAAFQDWVVFEAQVKMDDMLPDNVVGEGSFRTAYKMWDAAGIIFGGLNIAGLSNVRRLVYKQNNEKAIATHSSSIYFRDVHTQVVAQKNAAQFNKVSPRTHHLNFAPVAVIHAHERDGGGVSHPVLFSVEPYLQGDFIKWNTNALLPDRLRVAGREADVGPQAYSHFTYDESEGDLIVVDIQGAVQQGVAITNRNKNKNYLLTDPQIHSLISEETEDGSQLYGGGDRGEEGMNDFFEGHKCSQLCKDLEMKMPDHIKPHDPSRVKIDGAPTALLIVLMIVGSYLSEGWGAGRLEQAQQQQEHHQEQQQQQHDDAKKVSRLFSSVQQNGREMVFVAACIAIMMILISSAASAVVAWWHTDDGSLDRRDSSSSSSRRSNSSSSSGARSKLHEKQE